MPSPKQKVYVNGMGVIETTFLDLKPRGEVPKDYQSDIRPYPVSWDDPCDPLKDITEATEMVKLPPGLHTRAEQKRFSPNVQPKLFDQE